MTAETMKKFDNFFNMNQQLLLDKTVWTQLEQNNCSTFMIKVYDIQILHHRHEDYPNLATHIKHEVHTRT